MVRFDLNCCCLYLALVLQASVLELAAEIQKEQYPVNSLRSFGLFCLASCRSSGGRGRWKLHLGRRVGCVTEAVSPLSPSARDKAGACVSLHCSARFSLTSGDGPCCTLRSGALARGGVLVRSKVAWLCVEKRDCSESASTNSGSSLEWCCVNTFTGHQQGPISTFTLAFVT